MIDTIIQHAHTATELLLRQPSTPDIEEAIKLQDEIIRLASELRQFVFFEEGPLYDEEY